MNTSDFKKLTDKLIGIFDSADYTLTAIGRMSNDAHNIANAPDTVNGTSVSVTIDGDMVTIGTFNRRHGIHNSITETMYRMTPKQQLRIKNILYTRTYK